MATKKTLTIINPKTPVMAKVDTSALEKFLLDRLEYLSLRDERVSNRSMKLYDSDIDSDYEFEYDENYRESINWMSGGHIKDEYSDDSDVDETVNDWESYWDKTYHNF